MIGQRKSDPMLLELSTQVANLEDALRRQQTAPPVNDLWSGIVALARSSDLDGRVGPGDILVGVGLAGAGFTIGGIGATAFVVTGAPWEQSGTFLEYCTLAGCGLGLLRLSMDALAIPAMWSQLLDWAHDVIVDRAAARSEPEPVDIAQITVHYGDEVTHIDRAVPSQFEHSTRKIPSNNTESGWRTIKCDNLCAFLRYATATESWTRDSRPQGKRKCDEPINQKEWPDVRDWLKARGWWKLPPHSPLLPRACAEIRGRVTNGTEQNGTNGGTG